MNDTLKNTNRFHFLKVVSYFSFWSPVLLKPVMNIHYECFQKQRSKSSMQNQGTFYD